MITMAKKQIIQTIILINVFIYFTFLTIDSLAKNLYYPYSPYLKYTSIILCFFLTLLINDDGHDKKDTSLLQRALFFTVIADFFLVILNQATIGVFFFIFVQGIHIVRQCRKSNPPRRTLYKIFFFSVLCILLAITPFVQPIKIDPYLYLVSVVYAALLLTSLITAIGSQKSMPRKAYFLLVIGMCLFFLCDLNVALFNLVDNNKPSFFHQIPFGWLIWFFYLPSQILLSMSGYK